MPCHDCQRKRQRIRHGLQAAASHVGVPARAGRKARRLVGSIGRRTKRGDESAAEPGDE